MRRGRGGDRPTGLVTAPEGEPGHTRGAWVTVCGDLTERDTEALAPLARGLGNAETAGRLVVAERTVKTHGGRVLVKLGLRGRAQAAIFAYESGLIRRGRGAGRMPV
ncbi:hypothetical protein GTY81_27320 [Streptomyces sp. SID8366]|nr:hypothetical protein [Streptomyces sp. SID8366]MYU65175.1 hypothetical protein [Streptomyces sp. SID69]